MIDKIIETKITLKKIQEKKYKLDVEVENLSNKLKDLEDKRQQLINYKTWKAMEGKYYHVEMFITSDEDKFKNCRYFYIIKVEKDFLKYEYIIYEEDCKYIFIETYNEIHKRSYKKWNEISKKEYEKVISSIKELKRI